MKPKNAPVESTITVHVPITFTIRGGRKTVISAAVPPPRQPRIDDAVLNALARAHRWRKLVENGTFASITELAKAEGVNQSYACRLFRLTLLAPRIVSSLLDGDCTSKVLLKDVLKPLPSLWQEQQKRLQIIGTISAGGERSAAASGRLDRLSTARGQIVNHEDRPSANKASIRRRLS